MAQEFISCTHRMIPQFKASLVAGLTTLEAYCLMINLYVVSMGTGFFSGLVVCLRLWIGSKHLQDRRCLVLLALVILADTWLARQSGYHKHSSLCFHSNVTCIKLFYNIDTNTNPHRHCQQMNCQTAGWASQCLGGTTFRWGQRPPCLTPPPCREEIQ